MTTIISARVQGRLPFFTQLNDDQSETLHAMPNEPAEVPWKDEACEHGETMCLECWGTWAQDYEILTFTVMDNEGVTNVDMVELTRQLRERNGDESN